MKKTIKLYDGVAVNFRGETKRYDYIPDLWEAWRWDIESDQKAKQCAEETTRQLFCMGECVISLPEGTMLINLLPATEE